MGMEISEWVRELYSAFRSLITVLLPSVVALSRFFLALMPHKTNFKKEFFEGIACDASSRLVKKPLNSLCDRLEDL